MSSELIGILAVGVALAALILPTLRGMRTELRGDIRALDHRMRALEDRMGAQERSAARLGGLLEGLREAVVARAGSWSGSAVGVPVRRAAGGSESAPG